MPSGWGINVTMEDGLGRTYTEYGTSHLRTRLDTASRIMTTQVEARTGEKFGFRFQGRGPFLDLSDKDHASSDYSKRSSDRPSFEPPLIAWAPYALCVKILIDGKVLNSRLDVMYLTPHSPVMRNGNVINSCAITTGVNDKGEELYKEHDWVFADVGIEVRLVELGLSSPIDEANNDESVLDYSRTDEADSMIGNAGAIEVQLFRFVVEPRNSDQRARRSRTIDGEPRLGENAAEDDQVDYSAPPDTKPGEIDPNVTHTVKVVDRGEGSHAWDIVDGCYPDGSGEPYARYRFQYMSLAKLVKIGVANPDRSVITPGERKARVQRLRLKNPAGPPSQRSKRKSAENGNAHISIPTSTSKRPKEHDSQYGHGQQTVIPFRTKSTPKGHWLRPSQKQNPQSNFLQLDFSSKRSNTQSGQEHLEKRMADMMLKSPADEDETSLDQGTEIQRKLLPAINEADDEDGLGVLTTT